MLSNQLFCQFIFVAIFEMLHTTSFQVCCLVLLVLEWPWIFGCQSSFPTAMFYFCSLLSIYLLSFLLEFRKVDRSKNKLTLHLPSFVIGPTVFVGVNLIFLYLSYITQHFFSFYTWGKVRQKLSLIPLISSFITLQGTEVLIHQVHVTTYVVKFFSGHRNLKVGSFKSVFHVESKKRTHSGDHAFNV